MKSGNLDTRQWDDYWAKKAEKQRAAKAAGLIVVTRHGARLHIAAPYDRLFVVLANAAEAEWQHRTQVWSFPSGQWIAGLDAVVKCFGHGRLTPDWEHYWKTEQEKQA